MDATLLDGDVLVLDRCFFGWFDLALLQQRGEDVVGKRQLRTSDDSGTRLRKDNHINQFGEACGAGVVGICNLQRSAGHAYAS